MRNGLFQYRYYEFSKRILRIFNIIIFIEFLLIAWIATWLIFTALDLNRISHEFDKLSKKISVSEKYLDQNKHGDMKLFLKKLNVLEGTIKSETIGPVKMLNILEGNFPKDIVAHSIEYQSSENRYDIDATAINKSSISKLLDELESKGFSNVMLLGQRKSESKYRFNLVIKVY